MASVTNDRRLWIVLKRLDSVGIEYKIPDLLKFVTIPEAVVSELVHHIFTQVFDLNDAKYILKLRNENGSLIAINSQIPSNNESRPYTLEVLNLHQNVQPQPRTVCLPMYQNNLKKKLQALEEWIIRLEQHLLLLKERRNAKLQTEMEELNQKLEFLKGRLQIADTFKWQGRLKRSPLW